MDLIERLKQRLTTNRIDEHIGKWLNFKIDQIISSASSHLEYTRNVLNEFDEHDDNHSREVLNIIEKLLGDRADNLSSYDLFFLIAVSYLHDCGMAVSDFEINVMALVENDKYDGKKVCTDEQARKIIEENLWLIFKSETDANDVKNWLFYPGSDNALYDYYSKLLIDYQSFRNGRIDSIKQSKSIEDTNRELRIKYIRSTHAKRIDTYIRTWRETMFADFPNKPIGRRMADNLALACKAHCEDAGFIRGLEEQKNVRYLGGETSNLQFIAMMLRIGDIVHFSYKRAPIVLRALHHFESDDSHEHWRIKADSGVNYHISKDGEISFGAYCCVPKDYYFLMNYVDYIDQELLLYNTLKREENWESCYPILNKVKVNRDDIAHDDSFIPVPNLRFTLEQNRILDLLMGAKLYSNEYACIRELYQNSLDACRCQMAIDRNNGKESTGQIEFGIKDDGEGKYVYCLDNGKGMSKYIIEHYLLKIGSSFYRSSYFYQSQAATGNTFTPTSQFGIGILSCFMIGDKLEITTLEERGEFISCAMENIHECFYYRTPSSRDKERIASCGTLVKIYLNEKYRDKMDNECLENIGYLLWKKETKSDEKDSYAHHLYFILDGFVKIVPEDIVLNVKFDDGELLPIYNKPLRMGEGLFAYPKEEEYRINDINRCKVFLLDVEFEGVQCRKGLVLPTNSYSTPLDYNVLICSRSYAVDGIKVEDEDFVKGYFLETTSRYRLRCLVNFVGSERPQLNISRDAIVNYDPDLYEERIKGMLERLVCQAIDTVADYISENHVSYTSEHYSAIWEAFFKAFDDVPPSIVARCMKERPIQSLPFPLPDGFTSSKMTVGDFWGDQVRIENYRFYSEAEELRCTKLMHSLIKHRIYASDFISWKGKDVVLSGYHPDSPSSALTIPVSHAGGGILDDFDVAANLFPFVSQELFSLIDDEDSFNIHRGLTYLVKDICNYCRDQDDRLYRDEFQRSFYSLVSKYCNDNLNHLKHRFFFTGQSGLAITVFIPIITTRFRYYNRFFYRRNDLNDEGMSAIIFNEGEYLYFLPGRRSRQELVDAIPVREWRSLREDRHFADGTPVRKSRE